MSVKLKNLADQVIVLTGASSGIGLTTARLAASRGAKLVLAARNKEALEALTQEIVGRGGSAHYVVADVGNEADVARLAQEAIDRFGQFDTWINDAGVGVYGSLLDIPMADSKRLFDTNFWGVVYGSQAAARHYRNRNNKGPASIINVGSEVSDRSVPLIGMYAASKHAVKGFTDALRMELEKAEDPVSVTLVKPTAIDTPFPQHARNHMDQEPMLPSPVYAPDIVAEVILHCATNAVREMFAGGPAKIHSLEEKFMPRLTDRFMEHSLFEKQKSGKPASHAEEALYGPSTGLRERSGTRNDVKETSVYSTSTRHPWATGLVVAAAGIGLATLLGAAMGSDRDSSAN